MCGTIMGCWAGGWFLGYDNSGNDTGKELELEASWACYWGAAFYVSVQISKQMRTRETCVEDVSWRACYRAVNQGRGRGIHCVLLLNDASGTAVETPG